MVASPHFHFYSHERFGTRRLKQPSEAQRKAAANTALKCAKWVLLRRWLSSGPAQSLASNEKPASKTDQKEGFQLEKFETARRTEPPRDRDGGHECLQV